MASYWCCASRHLADYTNYHRRSQPLIAKRLRPLGCGPGLISDPVGQAKSVAFSVEGKAKAEALLQALFGASD
jgi:hypothetical protein